MKLMPTENELRGQMRFENGAFVGDDTNKRILEVTSSYLEKITMDVFEKNTLYLDPNDNRLWELVFERSNNSSQDVTPVLRVITYYSATRKYNLDDIDLFPKLGAEEQYEYYLEKKREGRKTGLITHFCFFIFLTLSYYATSSYDSEGLIFTLGFGILYFPASVVMFIVFGFSAVAFEELLAMMNMDFNTDLFLYWELLVFGALWYAWLGSYLATRKIDVKKSDSETSET